jgi:Secretion system C-terminal sorting domain
MATSKSSISINSFIKANFLVALTLIVFNGDAQFFSKRVDNSLTSMHQHVLLLPEGYMTVGIGYDSIDGVLRHPSSARGFDMNGEPFFGKEYYFNDKLWHPNLDCNARLNDSTIVFMALEYLENVDTIFNALFWKKNNGDTVRTKHYTSPYHNDNNIDTYGNTPTALVTSPDEQYIYYVAQIVSSPPIQNNFMIRKLNAQGDIVWTYINPLGSEYYSCFTLQLFNNKLWFEVLGQFNRLQSLDLDTVQLLDQIQLIGNGTSFFQANDMIVEEDGVVTACINQSSGTNIKPAIYKMDFSGNYIWQQVPIGDYAFGQGSDHLAKASDGGYVSCSVKYDIVPGIVNPNDPAYDNSNKRIWLWKVDSEGQLIWQRFYEWLSFDSTSYFHINNLCHDMKATPDGGYIMAGEASADCSNYPECTEFTQQGWLLKVDGCGCLVPGCDPSCTTTTNDLVVKPTFLKVGPNPTSDYINVYLGSAMAINPNGLDLELRSITGQLMRRFHLLHDETTYLIDTSAYAAGQYVLTLTNGTSILQQEKIVVMK